ncbi:CONSTANS-like zinc finger protein [Tripterygium wilfordii]|uniref:CONSTANS-like zinc finger protein n=1 Tax=Tripterygium wilfordii TaxID=458696 RepID=A0A7J7CBG8_TRIWF|nr:zinc finger protein CONSTANS-LIKE 13-like [Tripterygium wilfordii]XP_038682947.1 zinc finger protein CONSTANS-LIKE 13-like [Tripterygium wilfordii]KAF5731483.1 CONSTANS-like zinc finger protein [Tripterygium wilfordii]
MIGSPTTTATIQSMEPQNQQQQEQEQNRLCDYCNHSTALLYCRADSAKLCFSCDREVHSTNRLFSKHSRSQLCESCCSSPASIFCETEHSVLCQNCDWDRHGLSLSSLHNRRPIEGFTGCPSATEFVGIFGFDDVGGKALSLDEDSDCGGLGVDGYLDFLMWDAPAVGIDDMIASSGSGHDFQAMDVPPLPKNRNAACGKEKEEILRQLRELVKLEPNFNFTSVDVGPIRGFLSLETGQIQHHGETHRDQKPDAQPISFPTCEDNVLQWLSDSGEGAPGFFSSTVVGNHFEENHAVPEKYSDGGNGSHTSNTHEGQPPDSIPTETVSNFPKFAPCELNSQERETAISRYKEKKKTRRYDKHIRYESRKARAESRMRIKGRFAKTDH